MPVYLLYHRLHASQRAQQLHGLFRQVIQHSGGRIRICRMGCVFKSVARLLVRVNQHAHLILPVFTRQPAAIIRHGQ